MVLDDAMAKGARPTRWGSMRDGGSGGYWRRRRPGVLTEVILDAQPEAPPGLAVRIIAPAVPS